MFKIILIFKLNVVDYNESFSHGMLCVKTCHVKSYTKYPFQALSDVSSKFLQKSNFILQN